MMFILRQCLLYLLTIAFLIVTTIPQGVSASDIVENFQNLKGEDDNIVENIPEQYGRIFDTNLNVKENEKPDIILIYDMHCQPAVQKNIYSIINYFDSAFDVNKIFVEGARDGKVDVSSMKDFPSDSEIKEKVLSDMLSKGLLSGTEFYSYLSNKDNLYGIEDFDLYVKSIKRYEEILAYQKKFSAAISRADKDLKKAKKTVYDGEMRLFEELFFTDMEYDKEKFDNVYSLLGKYDINLIKAYPNVYKYLKIKEYEVFDVKDKTPQHYQELVNVAKNKIPYSIYIKILQEIKDKSLERQLVQLYTGTKQFLAERQLKEYAYIEKIKEKLSAAKVFNVKDFLTEKQFLYNNLLNKIFVTEVSKDTVVLTNFMNLLKQYVELKIDYDSYNELSYELKEFHEKLSTTDIISKKDDIIKILNNKKLAAYYDNNIARNKIFVNNILDKMEQNSTNIVVVGGFHKAIGALLNEKEIKYVSVLPNSGVGDYKIYNKIISDIAYFYNSLSDGLLVAGFSKIKLEEFLTSWITELHQRGFKEDEIISIINSWANKHSEFFKETPEIEIEKSDEKHNGDGGVQQQSQQVHPQENLQEQKQDIDVTDRVLKQNKFSLKGWLLKAKDTLKSSASKFKTMFTYKYQKEESDDETEDLDEKTIKRMEGNIRYFPFIQIMLGAELFESFATVFMQSSGYSLPFISLIMSLLAPITFAVSGIGGVIGDRISKRTLIVLSLVVHTMGTISFVISPLSPIFLVASQVLPTIGVAALSLALSPFLYESLDKLGKKESFKEIYGSNLSLFWIVMSISSLLGGLIASLTSQVTVIFIAAIPDVLVTIGAFIFTRSVKTKKDIKEQKAETEKVAERSNEQQETAFDVKEKGKLKRVLSNMFAPVIKLSSDKKTLSIAIVNIIVNNIFFVVLAFFLQPVLIGVGMNVGLLAPIYFAANIVQSLASSLINKVSFIVEKKFVRNVLFAAMTGMFAAFMVTGHPIFFILIFVTMNFWQGASSLTEVSAVYKVLDDNMRSKWLAFKTMFGTIISSITQVSISGLLAIGVSNNLIIAGAVTVMTAASVLIAQILDRTKKKPSSNMQDIEINTDQIKAMLACA